LSDNGAHDGRRCVDERDEVGWSADIDSGRPVEIWSAGDESEDDERAVGEPVESDAVGVDLVKSW
jgi:hypothetical protein